MTVEVKDRDLISIQEARNLVQLLVEPLGCFGRLDQIAGLLDGDEIPVFHFHIHRLLPGFSRQRGA